MTVRRVMTTYILCLALALAALSGCSEPERVVTIAYTNDMIGEIRSCGCASKDYGGLGRRATFLSGERRGARSFLLLEGGDFFGRDVNYGEEKAALTLEAMAYMGYDGIAPGENDFVLGLDYLVERAAALDLPVLAANVFRRDSGEQVFPSSRIVELDDGTIVGIIGAVGDGLRLLREAPDQIRVDPPRVAVQQAATELAARVDIVVVVAHMPVGEARRLAEQVPEVQLVICGHEGRPMRQIRKFGNAYVLQVTTEGKYIGLARATLQGGEIVQLGTTVVALSERFEDDEAMVKLFKSYDISILNLEKQGIGAGSFNKASIIKPFASAPSCESCHADVYASWAQTTHAHGFDVLVEAGRDLDRDCTPCHSTGFHNTGGFANAIDTPHLTGVQCEACHGNAHDHVKDPKELPATDASLACTTCHTKSQTPDFDFDVFWARIRH